MFVSVGARMVPKRVAECRQHQARRDHRVESGLRSRMTLQAAAGSR